MTELDFEKETTLLIHAFRHYNKRVKKYVAGKDTPEAAKLRLDKAFDNLVLRMNDPSIVFRFERLITAGAEINYHTIKELMLNISSDNLEIELSLAMLLNIKPEEVNKVISRHRNDVVPILKVSSTADIIDYMESTHDELVAATEEARKIMPRIEKKKRKRNIAQAIGTSIFGAMCGVVNTYAITGMPPAFASYMVMAGSFGTAIRDVIGEKPKE